MLLENRMLSDNYNDEFLFDGLNDYTEEYWEEKHQRELENENFYIEDDYIN